MFAASIYASAFTLHLGLHDCVVYSWASEAPHDLIFCKSFFVEGQ